VTIGCRAFLEKMQKITLQPKVKPTIDSAVSFSKVREAVEAQVSIIKFYHNYLSAN
jgi:hypothetical protein